MAAMKHFIWDSYLFLLRKAHRDLDHLKRKTPTGPDDEAYMDALFNLVCTTDHIFDWVQSYPPPGQAAADDMVKKAKTGGAPYHSVQVVHGLSNGLKHQVPKQGQQPPPTKVKTWVQMSTASRIGKRMQGGNRVRSGRVGSGARMRGADNPIRMRGSNAVRVRTGPGFVFEVDVGQDQWRPVVDVSAEALAAWAQLLRDHGLPT